MPPRPLPAVAVAAALLLASSFSPAAAQKRGAPTAAQVERRMLAGGAYLESLSAAQWAAGQGRRAVSHLARMLAKASAYPPESAGAFPFNAVWALGRIPGTESAAALSRFAATAEDPEHRAMARHALAAHRLRAGKKGDASFGVLGRDSMGELYEGPGTDTKLLQVVQPGQAVRILKERVESPTEEGPRGGPAVFDRVLVLSSGRTGYLQRTGDNFPSLY